MILVIVLTRCLFFALARGEALNEALALLLCSMLHYTALGAFVMWSIAELSLAWWLRAIVHILCMRSHTGLVIRG